MSHMTAHHVYDEEDGLFIASVHPAAQAARLRVLNADEFSDDGRSNWVWVRLRNGDLILGVFPQGETYEAVEYDSQFVSEDPRVAQMREHWLRLLDLQEKVMQEEISLAYLSRQEGVTPEMYDRARRLED